MTYAYKPRGKVAQIIEHMATEPDREWTRDEVGAVIGLTDSKGIASYLASAKRGGLLHTRKDGARLVYRINPYEPEPETPAEPVEFKVAIWSDGDLVMYGAPIGEDGTVILNADQKAVLRRMLVGEAAA